MHAFARPVISILATALLATLAIPAVGAAPASGQPAMLVATFDTSTSLRSRIGPPDPLVVETYAGAGATNITAHHLTDAEWRVVDAALARLPALHRRILQQHLKRLTFLDLQAGAGSALTSRLGDDTDTKTFAITLRASLLQQSLADFLDAKEANLLEPDASGYRVEFDAGDADALTYVLTHEATHVVDQVLGLTADPTSPLMAGTWIAARELAEPYRSGRIARTRFRGAARVPAAEAPALYRALGESPFASVYSTAAAAEDIAELFAWQQFSTVPGQTLTLRVVDGAGKLVFEYAPLDTPRVKQRRNLVQDILDDASP